MCFSRNPPVAQWPTTGIIIILPRTRATRGKANPSGAPHRQHSTRSGTRRPAPPPPPKRSGNDGGRYVDMRREWTSNPPQKQRTAVICDKRCEIYSAAILLLQTQWQRGEGGGRGAEEGNLGDRDWRGGEFWHQVVPGGVLSAIQPPSSMMVRALGSQGLHPCGVGWLGPKRQCTAHTQE